MTLNLTSDLVSRNWCISPIFFEIGIPNLVCKCILGCLSVTNYFWVTVTLTSDLVFEKLCPEHICYIIWCRNPKFGVVIPLGMAEWCIPFWVTLTLTLTSGLSSRFFVLIFPQMCLMLDQFLWGHSSRVCDISCLHPLNQGTSKFQKQILV